MVGRATGRLGGRGEEAGPDPAAAEVASLERLAALHREGSLSDEEFARAKGAVLASSAEA
jgi:hypothetical protein